MRDLTSRQREVLGLRHYASHMRLRVETESGGLRDITSWVDSVAWGQNIDQPIPELTATMMLLDTSRDGESFSPLMDLQTDIGRRITLHVAVTEEQQNPTSADWANVFGGVIHSVSFGQDPIQISALGHGQKTGTRWIEEETEYGTEAGRPIQSVMRDILDDWADGVGLVVPASPGFHVTRYMQQPMSVQDALQRLAALIGWIITVKEIEGTDRLAFVDPERGRTQASWSFGPDDYFSVDRLDLDLTTIRNAITIKYVDGDGETQQVSASNPTSIERYGRLWMEIQEGDESPIDTAQEARRMLVPAVADLSEPFAEQEITTKFFWPVEVGDLLAFQPNEVHYRDAQRWAVVDWQQRLSLQEDVTVITVRGKPAGSYRAWRGAPGGGPEVVIEPFGDISLDMTYWETGPQQLIYGFTVTGNESARSFGWEHLVNQIPTEPDRIVNARTAEVDFNVVGGLVPVPVGSVYNLGIWFYSGPDGTGTRSQRILVKQSGPQGA